MLEALKKLIHKCHVSNWTLCDIKLVWQLDLEVIMKGGERYIAHSKRHDPT